MYKNTFLILIVVILIVGGIYFIKKNKNLIQINRSIVKSHRSYDLVLLSPKNIGPNQETEIHYKITNDMGATVKDFEIDHTKLMHFIVVRSDLQDFQHLHPEFNSSTGEFIVSITFQNNGKYRFFADFVPSQSQKDSEGNNLAVTTTLDLIIGDLSKYKPQEVAIDKNTEMPEGEYEFAYSLPQPIKVGIPATIIMNVAMNGRPVYDMEEYLGAQAHGILLKKDTLNFTHLHAMGAGMTHVMGGKMMTMYGSIPKGPEIKFNYTFPESGVYKLFTQFQHQDKVITTDYIVEVK